MLKPFVIQHSGKSGHSCIITDTMNTLLHQIIMIIMSDPTSLPHPFVPAKERLCTLCASALDDVHTMMRSLNDVFLRIFLSLNDEWFFYNLDGLSYRNIQFWESKSVCWLTQVLERASFLDYILLMYEEEREIVLVPALFCKDLNLTHKRSHLNDLIIFQSPSCKFHHIEIWVSTYELGEMQACNLKEQSCTVVLFSGINRLMHVFDFRFWVSHFSQIHLFLLL